MWWFAAWRARVRRRNDGGIAPGELQGRLCVTRGLFVCLRPASSEGQRHVCPTCDGSERAPGRDIHQHPGSRKDRDAVAPRPSACTGVRRNGEKQGALFASPRGPLRRAISRWNMDPESGLRTFAPPVPRLGKGRRVLRRSEPVAVRWRRPRRECERPARDTHPDIWMPGMPIGLPVFSLWEQKSRSQPACIAWAGCEGTFHSASRRGSPRMTDAGSR